jgi:hypothetical protein
LERCIQGNRKGALRAVKSLQKVASTDYYRELEVIALFSHGKVRLDSVAILSLPLNIETCGRSMNNALSNLSVGMKMTTAFSSQWNFSSMETCISILSLPLPETEAQLIVGQHRTRHNASR